MKNMNQSYNKFLKDATAYLGRDLNNGVYPATDIDFVKLLTLDFHDNKSRQKITDIQLEYQKLLSEHKSTYPLGNKVKKIFQTSTKELNENKRMTTFEKQL